MRGLLRILAFLSLAFCPSGGASALESLNYGPEVPVGARVLLSDWLARETGLEIDAYAIASADLNRDGMPEYVLKPLKCYDPKGFCTFLILADAQKNMVLLGKISAKNLALGDSYHSGVQDILAFLSNNNDYEYDIFVWDPPSMAYVLNGRTEG